MAAHKKILGVDFDDVLFNCDEALAQFHNTRYGTSYTTDERNSFYLEPFWNCSAEEVQKRLDEFTYTEFHENANVVTGAREALERLSDVYDIVIVTGRADIARSATEKWLEKNLLGLYREIHFSNHGGTGIGKYRLKSEILRELGIDIFVEDAPHFAADVAGAGITVFLFDTPWNRAETPDGAIRVRSWEEIVEQLRVH
jgi:uncharacterized HAD superfamily protein